jgi:hypothetical protein
MVVSGGARAGSGGATSVSGQGQPCVRQAHHGVKGCQQLPARVGAIVVTLVWGSMVSGGACGAHMVSGEGGAMIGSHGPQLCQVAPAWCQVGQRIVPAWSQVGQGRSPWWGHHGAAWCQVVSGGATLVSGANMKSDGSRVVSGGASMGSSQASVVSGWAIMPVWSQGGGSHGLRQGNSRGRVGPAWYQNGQS